MGEASRGLVGRCIVALIGVLSNRKLIRVLSHPELLIRSLLRHIPDVPVSTKVDLDLYDRPNYAYGLWTAAREAKALGTLSISAIEFGVGTGYGLLEMERIAAEIEGVTGVTIEVVGFDNGAGLPPPEDYRDLPYLYSEGYYAMDGEALRSRLTRARLIVGDVKDTVSQFLATVFPPIGFVSFDLDYYSSTKAAMSLFSGDLHQYLPRVVCYFDDMSNPDALQCSFTGEALAIEEFNAERADAKLDLIAGLRGSRLIDANWPDVMHACHFFTHPLYSKQMMADAGSYIAPLAGVVN